MSIATICMIVNYEKQTTYRAGDIIHRKAHLHVSWFLITMIHSRLDHKELLWHTHLDLFLDDLETSVFEDLKPFVARSDDQPRPQPRLTARQAITSVKEGEMDEEAL